MGPDELRADAFAGDGDVPGGGPLEMSYAAQQRGLARAARADDRDLLARSDGEMDVFQDLDLAEALGDTDDLDQLVRRGGARRVRHGQANSAEKSLV